MTSDLKNNFDEWYDVNNISDIESIKLIRSLKLRYFNRFKLDILTKIELA